MIGAAIGGFKALPLLGRISTILNIVLIGGAIILLLMKNATIAELRRSIDNPKTGYKAQIALLNRDMATCRANVSGLRGGIEAQNRGIEAVAEAARANAALGKVELERARLANKPLEVKVRQVSSDTAKSADLCAEADRVLLETVK